MEGDVDASDDKWMARAIKVARRAVPMGEVPVGAVVVHADGRVLAEAHNLPVTSHGVHDLSVHLLAAVPNDSFLEVHMFGLEPYMKHALIIEDGFAIAPDRPGHGVELDWERLDEHRIA